MGRARRAAVRNEKQPFGPPLLCHARAPKIEERPSGVGDKGLDTHETAAGRVVIQSQGGRWMKGKAKAKQNKGWCCDL
jgi:hypothetical protein